MLPSLFLKDVGFCLLILGVYDSSIYGFALIKGGDGFNFFGRILPARHPLVIVGFLAVLSYYYLVGALLVILG